MQEQKKAVVIALANRKGGIGKTTGTAMLGTMLKLLGCRVMVIDNDPQHSLTTSLGYTGYQGPNLYNVLLDEERLPNCVLKTAIDSETRQFYDSSASSASPRDKTQAGPFLVPITTAASNADFALKSQIDTWVFQMRDALETVTPSLDYVLIDCGPSLGTLTLSALTAADYVLIPVLPERSVVEGLAELIGVIASTKRRMNRTLQIAGIYFNMVQQNWRAHREIREEMRLPATQRSMVRVLGDDSPPLRVFDTEIRHNAALASSANHHSLLVLDNAESVHTKAYWLLLAELLDVVGGAGKEKALKVAENIQTGV